jgi:hypothetical protein
MLVFNVVFNRRTSSKSFDFSTTLRFPSVWFAIKKTLLSVGCGMIQRCCLEVNKTVCIHHVIILVVINSRVQQVVDE